MHRRHFPGHFATHALIRVFASGRVISGPPVHFEVLTNPDAHVLLFTLAIALVTGLLCGAAPAVSASKTEPASALQQASRIGESKSRRLFGKGLVASQVALSLVLMSSAALFVEYLSHLRNRIWDSSAIICCWSRSISRTVAITMRNSRGCRKSW